MVNYIAMDGSGLDFMGACVAGDALRVKMLLGRYCNIMQTELGAQSLYMAIIRGHMGCVKAIVRKLSYKWLSRDKYYAFCVACYYGHRDIALYLSRMGKMSTSDMKSRGLAAYWMAGNSGHRDTVKWLMSVSPLNKKEMRSVMHLCPDIHHISAA